MKRQWFPSILTRFLFRFPKLPSLRHESPAHDSLKAITGFCRRPAAVARLALHLAWRPWPSSRALARVGHPFDRPSRAANNRMDPAEQAAAPIPDARLRGPRALLEARDGRARFVSLRSSGAQRWISRVLP